MNLFGRREPAHDPASSHERARTLAAARIDWPLSAPDEAWLDEHLADCGSCAAAAAGYAASHLALRALRGTTPEPPRDLWARTSAAIERESARARVAGSPVTGPRSRRSNPAVPLGAVSGVMVVVILLGVTILSGPVGPRPGATSTGVGALASDRAPGPTDRPVSTPLTVEAGSVEWLRLADGGRYDYTIARVDEVCSTSGQPDCATIPDGAARQSLDLLTTPKTIIGSPTNDEAIVVGEDDVNGNEVFVVALPVESQGIGSEASPEPIPPSTAPASPTPTATIGPRPPASVEPSASISSSPEPTPVATDSPSPTSSPDPTDAATPVPSPTPTAAARLAIASDVTVVGETAAFAADGTWFAFTARPSNDAHGPDIYAWRRGDETARALTSDHRSIFASWLGDSILGSRAAQPLVDGQNDAVAAPTTFIIDPATGVETARRDAGWRPVVDPTERYVISWNGTVSVTGGGLDWRPASGALELRAWSASGKDASPGEVLSTGPVADFDVRWDESGDWVAVWIADDVDPAIGRLTLYRLDPLTGAAATPENSPDGVAALPGFSIGDGRLAWATPSGQGGEGSRVRIVAWTNEGVGEVESAPGEDVVVIR